MNNILESEKKLRIRHLIKYFPDQLNYKIDQSVHLQDFFKVNVSNYEIVFCSADFDNNHEMCISEANFYVSGYAAYKISKKLDCTSCKQIFITTYNNSTSEYIKALMER